MGDPLTTAPRRKEHECKVATGDDIEDRDLVKSTPADPRQRVGNADRSPEPYVDLQVAPNLTGTFFELGHRYRLFINHVGGHLECLLTLVSNHRVYTLEGRKPGTRDARLPDVWGPLQGGRHPAPIAFRFCGNFVGDRRYQLIVPPWMLRGSDVAGGMINVGELEVRGSGDSLMLTLEDEFVDAWPQNRDAKQAIVERRSTAPVLLDRYLDLPSVPFEFRTSMWFPLTDVQQSALGTHAVYAAEATISVDAAYRAVKSGGTPMTLVELIGAARSVAHDADDDATAAAARRNAVESIDALVGKIFTKAASMEAHEGGLSQDEIEPLTDMILDELATTEAAPGLSMLTALQRLVDDAGVHPDRLRNLARHFGLGSRGWGRHEYEIEIEGLKLVEVPGGAEANAELRKRYKLYKKALELALEQSENVTFAAYKSVMKYLPLTWMIGHVTVRYTGRSEWNVRDDETPPKESPSTGYFGILLGGIELSKSTVMADQATIDWRATSWIAGKRPVAPEELRGAVHMVQVSAFAGVNFGSKSDPKGWSAGKSKTWVEFLGDGIGKSIKASFDGSFVGAEGAAAGAKGLIGYMWPLGTEPGKIVLPRKKKDKERHDGYWGVNVPHLHVHFPINGAKLPIPTEEEANLLVEEGGMGIREALEVFAACELPLLAHPLMAMKIVGHADRPDNEARNRDLSRSRAMSVFNYLHGLLGDRLTLGRTLEEMKADPPPRVAIVGEGETLAQKAHEENEFAQSFRRADVEIAFARSKTPDAEVFASDDLALRVVYQGVGKKPKTKVCKE